MKRGTRGFDLVVLAISLGDLAAQHNEHRILVPRLVMLALAQLTSWNSRVPPQHRLGGLLNRLAEVVG